MAAHTIRKVSRDGIGYSVVDLQDVRHVFAAAVPRRGSTLREQADDALQTIAAAPAPRGSPGSIVHQAVFVADVGQIDECRQIIRDFYGNDLPATSYIPQPPCDGKLLAIEALGVGQDRGDGRSGAIRRTARDRPAQRRRLGALRSSRSANGAGAVYDAAYECLSANRSPYCSRVSVRFDQVIRTWLYLGGIVDVDDGDSQRYRELNRARHRLLPRHSVPGRATSRRTERGPCIRPAPASAPRAATS